LRLHLNSSLLSPKATIEVANGRFSDLLPFSYLPNRLLAISGL